MKLLSEGIKCHMGHNTYHRTSDPIVCDFECTMEAYFV